MPATMISYAANTYLWIFAANLHLPTLTLSQPHSFHTNRICVQYSASLTRTMKSAGLHSHARKQSLSLQVEPECRALNPGSTYPEITMPATMISYAANTYLWISCSNTSAPEQCWPAFAVRPGGVVVGRLEKNVPGVLVTDVDTEKKFYDSTVYWRGRAMEGVLHSGEIVKIARADVRTELW